MADRPILFSAPMVRALLAGTKTQTRRVVKNADVLHLLTLPDFTPADVAHPGNRYCPYGVPGDRLWVKETWRMPSAFDGASPARAKTMVRSDMAPNVFYAADGAVRAAGAATGNPGKTRVSIHMPRWASRLTLRITDVRVERLNDISEADALAEGMTFPEGLKWGNNPVEAYARLWDHINGPGSWAANPWVWAVTFQRVEPTP